MKVLKYLAQIAAAIAYTGLFTMLAYLVLIYPLAWYLSLSVFWMVFIFIFGFTLIVGILSAVIMLSAAPYIWITKNNMAALVISEFIMITNFIVYSVRLWRDNYGGSGAAMCVCIVITFALIAIAFSVSNMMIGSYKQN